MKIRLMAVRAHAAAPLCPDVVVIPSLSARLSENLSCLSTSRHQYKYDRQFLLHINKTMQCNLDSTQSVTLRETGLLRWPTTTASPTAAPPPGEEMPQAV